MASTVPVGSIVAFAGDIEKLDGTTWAVCDGRHLNQVEYMELYGVMLKTNGGETGTFALPDLRGRFIRGAGSLYGVGATHDFTTGPPQKEIRVTWNCVPRYQAYHGASGGIQGHQMMDVQELWSVFGPSGNDDRETRPKNMYMYYIIKLRDGPIKADLPAGAVFPYAAADGYLPLNGNFATCDGSTVPGATHRDALDAVGRRFASTPQGDDSTTPDLRDQSFRVEDIVQCPDLKAHGPDFTVADLRHYDFPGGSLMVCPDPEVHAPYKGPDFTTPDLRDQFIRGVDDEGRHDPEFDARHKAPDGSSRGRGTTQDFATRLRNPRYQIQCLNLNRASSSRCTAVAGWDGIANDGWTSESSISGGDDETRPRNYALRFLLNPNKPTAYMRADLPIGGIIAVAGPTDAPHRHFLTSYLLCDGSEYAIGEYFALASLLRDGDGDYRLWGAASARDKFRVPDFRDAYLRGKTDWRPTGHHQDAQTARPRNLRGNADPYPSACRTVAAGRGNTIYEYTEAASFLVEADWQQETAPASAVVHFYVRAQ